MTKIANLDFKYDYSPVILWQYSDAENLKKIVANEESFLDTAITQFKDDFDNYIFNLDTCDANGLELWGKLLQVGRPMVEGEYFNDEQYRLLLKSRIYILVWDGSCAGLTKLIHSLFPTVLFSIEDCPIDDNNERQNMVVNIDFASGLTPEQEVVLTMGYNDEDTGEFVYTFLPRPAGVTYNISFEGDWATTLGFAEIVHQDGTWEGMTETTNLGDENDRTTGGVFYK